MDHCDKIRERLFGMQDEAYRAFHCKLMPTVDKERVIGVRIPQLKKYAAELHGTGESTAFLENLPHRYYEENNLHSFLICQIKEFDTCIEAVERFLPYVDNWATCDSLRPRCFRKNSKALLPYIDKWLLSEHTYTVRFGIEMLMVYFLDSDYLSVYPSRVAEIISEEYYINMMIAWYFATALAKQWDDVIEYVEKNILPVWVHNKTIQKAVESYRITDEKKEYLKSLKR